MADPTRYAPSYSFNGWQTSNPSKPLPGSRLDNELFNIAESLGGAVNAITDIRRADGRLRNGIVTADSLAPGLLPGGGGSDGGGGLVSFTNIVGKPTSLAGYGIGDAYTKLQVNAQIDAAVASGGGSGGTGTDTPSQLLTKLKTVDGSSSGLDADLLDGLEASVLMIAANPKRYGAKGDGVTDDTAAIQACLDANSYIEFPAGKYILSAALTKTGILTLKGAGHATQLSWPAGAASRGIVVTQQQIGPIRTMTEVRGLRLSTRDPATNGASALKVIGVAPADRFTVSAIVENVHMDGEGGSFTRGWGVGLDFQGCQGVYAENCHFWGQMVSNFYEYVSTVAFKYTNPANLQPHPTEFQVTNCTAKCVAEAVYVDDMEGLLVLNCQFVGVDVGVRAHGALEFPHASILNCHINSTDTCIIIDKMFESLIGQNLLYTQGADKAGTGIAFVNGAKYFNVVGNQFEDYGDFSMNGVIVGAGCGSGTIAANIFRRMNSLDGDPGLGVWLVAGSSRTYVSPDNIFEAENTARQVLDSGTQNFFPGYGARFAKSSDQSLPANQLNILNFGTTVSFQGNAGASMSTGAFVVPSTGVWNFTASVQLDTSGAGGYVCSFQKNAVSGAAIATVAGNSVANVVDIFQITTGPKYLAAGDVIRLGVNPGVARSSLNTVANFFEALRLS